MAQQIVSDFDATIAEKLDGLDQRYWDIQIGEVALTLHLGIFLFSAKGLEDNPAAKGLIERIGKNLIS